MQKRSRHPPGVRRGHPRGVKINSKGPNFTEVSVNMSVFSLVDSDLGEIKGEMCNSWALSLPGRGVWSRKSCSLLWLADGVSVQTVIAFMIIFLSVPRIKGSPFRSPGPLFYCPPQIILLSVLCLVFDSCKAFDKIHWLLKKKKKSNPSCCILLVEYKDETICQKAAKSLPFPCNYECSVERCKLKPLCTLTLQSNCLIKLVFPPERYINKWTVEQIKNT